jgi:hypothetical protein
MNSDQFDPLHSRGTGQSVELPARVRPLLVIVEGVNDLEFFIRLSRRLRQEDLAVIDLALHQANGRLILAPIGGGDVVAWATRFSPLGCPEFQLCDRELPADEAVRRRAMDLVNARPNCRGFVTSKRALENYLHRTQSALLAEARLSSVTPTASARCSPSIGIGRSPKSELNRRARQRLTHRAKRWLNREAVERMTGALLASRDPDGEVRHWLRTIAELLELTQPGGSLHG